MSINILITIGQYLKFNDLINFFTLSRKFKEISENMMLWKNIYLTHWRESDVIDINKSEIDFNWKAKW